MRMNQTSGTSAEVPVWARGRRIANPPQVSNLAHKKAELN
jgi:hypothetical protein